MACWSAGGGRVVEEEREGTKTVEVEFGGECEEEEMDIKISAFLERERVRERRRERGQKRYNEIFEG